MSLSELPEDIHLFIIDFLICDLQNDHDRRMKFLLSNDIEMACTLELIYGKQTKYKQVIELLNIFWIKAIKQQFNLDEQWIKNDYHVFINEYFNGNMKRLYAALCHSYNILHKEESKEERGRLEPRFSMLSILCKYPSVLISQDGCEKHKIISMIDSNSNDSDEQLVKVSTHIDSTFFIDFSIDEIKVNTLKDYLYNNNININNEKLTIENFKSVISICRSDNEESFKYMMNGLKYCLEIRKTYRMPCFIVLNSMNGGPHIITKDRIEMELKNLKISLFQIIIVTSETSSKDVYSCITEFVHDAFFQSVTIKNERERLIQTLQKTVKKKCIIQ